jgi:hypothetical protein
MELVADASTDDVEEECNGKKGRLNTLKHSPHHGWCDGKVEISSWIASRSWVLADTIGFGVKISWIFEVTSAAVAVIGSAADAMFISIDV